MAAKIAEARMKYRGEKPPLCAAQEAKDYNSPVSCRKHEHTSNIGHDTSPGREYRPTDCDDRGQKFGLLLLKCCIGGKNHILNCNVYR